MTATDTTTFADEWTVWHEGQEARIGDRHGFLAITDLHWLSDEPQRLAHAPGTWTADSTGVTVVLDDGDELAVDGVTVTGTHSFGVLAERQSINAVWGDAVIEVARRGGYDIVRPRHPDNALRTAFTGTPAYEPDPRWRVNARYVAFDEPRPTTVGAVVDDLQHVYDAPGRLEFELDGEARALTAFPGHGPGALMVLFTDETSGRTTYAANRIIALDPAGPDGTIVLDFNRAANLPCAYTDLATCPLPPAENHLPLAVEVGEKIPYERSGH